MSFSFRIRVDLADVRVNVDERQLELALDASRKITIAASPLVRMDPRPPEEVPIAKAESFWIQGHEFASEQDAWAAGRKVGDALARALAVIHACADFGQYFGTYGQRGGFFKAALEMLSQQYGVPVLNDTHGLMVFEASPGARFAKLGKPRLQVARPKFVKAMQAALQIEAPLSERERVAYDLYSASHFIARADARLITLVTAVEALSEEMERSPAAVALVRQMVRMVADAPELPDDERNSLLGSIRRLEKESIGQAGRRMARELRPRVYLGKDAERFFRDCYDLRSRLVHGGLPKPQREVVGRHAAELANFVGDLLAGPLRDVPLT